jgi:hypothetical protein
LNAPFEAECQSLYREFARKDLLVVFKSLLSADTNLTKRTRGCGFNIADLEGPDKVSSSKNPLLLNAAETLGEYTRMLSSFALSQHIFCVASCCRHCNHSMIERRRYL